MRKILLSLFLCAFLFASGYAQPTTTPEPPASFDAQILNSIQQTQGMLTEYITRFNLFSEDVFNDMNTMARTSDVERAVQQCKDYTDEQIKNAVGMIIMAVIAIAGISIGVVLYLKSQEKW